MVEAIIYTTLYLKGGLLQNNIIAMDVDEYNISPIYTKNII